MTIRLKIIPNPQDVAKFRKDLVQDHGEDSEYVRYLDMFFKEFETKLGSCSLLGKNYAVADAIDFTCFIDSMKRRKKQLSDIEISPLHLDRDSHMTFKFVLEPELIDTAHFL